MLEQGNKRVHELSIAIDRFFFHCQPIVRLNTKQVVMYELLARTLNEVDDIVSAWSLISEINQHEALARKLDLRALLFVLDKLKQGETTTYAINLSGATLNQPHAIGTMVEQIQASGVNPKQICFEVTEHVTLNSYAVKSIWALRGCGVLVGVDDFGAGYNSLLDFVQQDYDFIKLEGAFSRGLLSDSRKHLTVVMAVFTIAAQLGIPVVCEAIETELIERHLIRLRDSHSLFSKLELQGQGWYYGLVKPCQL